MTKLRTVVAGAICVGTLLGLHTVSQAPVYVPQCQDPGFYWCGGNVFSYEQYSPDGQYREDGSIPLKQYTHVR